MFRLFFVLGFCRFLSVPTGWESPELMVGSTSPVASAVWETVSSEHARDPLISGSVAQHLAKMQHAKLPSYLSAKVSEIIAVCLFVNSLDTL